MLPNMCSVLLLWAFLLCLFSVHDCLSNRNKVCYQAKTCIHSGNERCGIDSEGNPKRFYDSCDIMEYNCLQGTNYEKTTAEKCKDLAPIEDNNKVAMTGNITNTDSKEKNIIEETPEKSEEDSEKSEKD